MLGINCSKLRQNSYNFKKLTSLQETRTLVKSPVPDTALWLLTAGAEFCGS